MSEVYRNFLDKAVEYCELSQYLETTENLHIIVRN